MPNYCTNEVYFKEEVVEEVKKFLDKDGNIDFNKVIPAPLTQEDCERDFPAYVIHNEEEARKECLNYDETNERRWFNWYRWNIDFWGTKWNSFDNLGTSDQVVAFITAWCPCSPVIRKLSELLHTRIVYSFQEEGCGINGVEVYENGELIEEVDTQSEYENIMSDIDYDDDGEVEDAEEKFRDFKDTLISSFIAG